MRIKTFCGKVSGDVDNDVNSYLNTLNNIDVSKIKILTYADNGM